MPSGKKGSGEIAVCKCNFCGKTFQYPTYPSWPKRKYCSRKCSNQANVRKGEANNRWNGGVYIASDGRKRLKIGNGKYEAEYRLLLEKHLGRKLKSDEIIHHIDGDIHNNAIENLQVLTRSEHARIHGIKNCNLRKKVI